MFRSRRPTPALVVALLALVVALAGTAGADPIASVARAISGKSIKKRSVAGNRLKKNTVTGKEIKESKLGKVPKAKRADSAAKADRATKADAATKATTADSATNAANAANATNAITAATAVSAAHATSADSATDAGELDGMDSTSFVQGVGRRVVYRSQFVANTALTKLFDVDKGGVVRGACNGAATPTLDFLNNTGATTATSITTVVPGAPHATTDYAGAPFSTGADLALTVAQQTWTIQIGAGVGRPQGALLTVAAFKEGTKCTFDVQGTSSLTMTFKPIL